MFDIDWQYLILDKFTEDSVLMTIPFMMQWGADRENQPFQATIGIIREIKKLDKILIANNYKSWVSFTKNHAVMRAMRMLGAQPYFMDQDEYVWFSREV